MMTSSRFTNYNRGGALVTGRQRDGSPFPTSNYSNPSQSTMDYWKAKRKTGSARKGGVLYGCRGGKMEAGGVMCPQNRNILGRSTGGKSFRRGGILYKE